MPSGSQSLEAVMAVLPDSTHRKMMGEYLLYRDGVLFGGIYGLSMFCDWGMVAPIYAIAFAAHRDSRSEQAKWFSIVTVGYVIIGILFCVSSDQNWYGQLWQAGLFLFLPFLFLYNGERGSKGAFHKWFFYVFYPLQFIILWLIKYVV